ncbi:MAG: hypothetical protein ACRENV_08865 [Candidatus Dormibacteria bacterium]
MNGHRLTYDRRRSGGFLRLQPWLQSASDERRALLSWMALAGAILIGAWTLFSLVAAGSHPQLPSSHAVQIAVHPNRGSGTAGQGHLVWYRRGKLLVFAVTVTHLAPNRQASAYLVPSASCGGTRPPDSKLLGRVRSDARGQAQFNDELLGVSDLRFGSYSVWIEESGSSAPPRACGVLSLSHPGQV